jgi:hypothetical protein
MEYSTKLGFPWNSLQKVHSMDCFMILLKIVMKDNLNTIFPIVHLSIWDPDVHEYKTVLPSRLCLLSCRCVLNDS